MTFLEGDTEIRHGYTVSSASRLASVAIRSAATRGAHDLEEKHSVAICAIITELHEHNCDPGSHVLIRAAEHAIDNARTADWSSWGINRQTREFQKGFQPYWRPGAHTPIEDRVTEQIALWQILAALTQRQRETLGALYVCGGDPKAAALLLGIKPVGVAGNLRNIRAAFLELWFEHETPPEINWRRGRTNIYSEEAAAERPEIARRAVRIREQRRATAAA
jgi:hypothetical protein